MSAASRVGDGRGVAAERVTTVVASDTEVAGVGTVAILRFAPAEDPDADRPCTLGIEGLARVESAVTTAAERAEAGEIAAVLLTGTGRTFLAGADLHLIRTVTDRALAEQVARAGHRVVAHIADLGVPTIAYLNGTTLGGGLEIALSCDFRIADPGVRAVGLPETHLGLLPGWGGCTLLPRLIGPDAALRLIIDNPARNNRTLGAEAAHELGLVDAVLPSGDPGDPDGPLGPALAWIRTALTGQAPARIHAAPESAWQEALQARRAAVEARAAGGAPAPRRALATVEAARTLSRDEAFAREDEALVDLVMTDELRAGLYGFDLLTRRAKHPSGRPSHAGREISAVGIAGAGLMAGQLAMLFAHRLGVPVTMRDLDAERADRGLAAVHAEVDRQVERGRLAPADGAQLKARLRATTDVRDLSGSDLVVEAVFEELDVKREVFAELEEVVAPHAVLATNTSALSVGAMAEALRHPERVVGLHFFNPVAAMPLVEVVRAESTDTTAYATAFAVAQACRKTAVAVADAPGFVVNRLLLRLLGEVLGALEEGTSIVDADAALGPMGLPMGPFQLLDLVGPAVAHHVLQALRRGLGERYPDSPGLAEVVRTGRRFVRAEDRPQATSPVDPSIAEVFGSRTVAEPMGRDELLRRVREALADETARLLDEQVVADAGDVDLAMILGAGWPLHNGGLTPYLDRTGASVAVTGERFHAPGVADLPR